MLDSAKSHCLGVARVTVLTLALSLQVTCPYVGCGESFADHSTIHAQVGVGVGRQGTALATACPGPREQSRQLLHSCCGTAKRTAGPVSHTGPVWWMEDGLASAPGHLPGRLFLGDGGAMLGQGTYLAKLS